MFRVKFFKKMTDVHRFVYGMWNGTCLALHRT